MLNLDFDFLREGALLTEPGGDLRLGSGFLGRFGSPQEASKMGSQAVFYAPDFFLQNPTPWLGFARAHSLSLQELEDYLVQWCAKGSQEVEAWQEPNRESFKADFLRAQDLFRQGLVQKVVPVVFARRPGHLDLELRVRALLRALRSLKSSKASPRGASSWLYGYWSDLVGEGLLGLSPELLFCLESPRRLRTLALAGTGTVDGPCLLQDAKQLAEHNWVVRGLRDRLGPLGELTLGETFEWALPHLKHLRTDIEVELTEPEGFVDLVQRLHPTAALGTFPPEALPLWTEGTLESNRDRGQFGAPFGFYQNPESGPTWAVVAIRNLQWGQGETTLGSGCGLVAQSQFSDEWDELSLKRLAVRKIFEERS